ncbi:acetyltransferase [Candidatus Dojkabacteria bacterium]|nr:acetyltransferase [Candidatus Dojkabacteria bacterium]
MKDIYIFGAGTMSNTYIDIIESTQEYKIVGLIDDRYPQLTEAYGFKVVGNTESIKDMDIEYMAVCIGDNNVREIVVNKIKDINPNITFPSLVHRSAYVSPNAQLGEGVVIRANVTIDRGCVLEKFTWVGANSVIPHNSILEEYSSVSAGVNVGGEFRLGKYSYMGIGSTAKHCITVGENTVIGAGSVVLESIPNNTTAYGIPCKVIRSREKGERYL